MINLILRNATLLDHNSPINLAIDEGRIIGLGERLDYTAEQEIELAGCLVIPGFDESHLHLDIALSNSGEKPGRDKPIRDIKQMNGRSWQCRIAPLSGSSCPPLALLFALPGSIEGRFEAFHVLFQSPPVV